MKPALPLLAPPELVEAIAQRAAEILAEREPRPEPFLDVAQAAEHLVCSPNRIYALSSAGRIPSHRDGSRLLFKRSELDDWVARGGGKRP